MLRTGSLFVVGVCCVVWASEYGYSLDRATGSESNGSDWEVARFIISGGEVANQTVCGTADIDTMTVLCKLSGYTTYSEATGTYTWSSALDMGYTVSCGDRDTFSQCSVTADENCSTPLVLNCTDHYKSVIGTVSINDMIMPIILIPVCILYIVILCYLESEDVRKNKDSRKKLVVSESVKAFQNSGNDKEGTV